MPLFNSPKIKHAANKTLLFGTIYMATGIIINSWGPIIGSLYGLLIAKKDRCHYISKGDDIAKLYFFPITAVYNKLASSNPLQEQKLESDGPGKGCSGS